MNRYNSQAIETFLRHTFEPLRLVIFCYDYYPVVYRTFTADISHAERVTHLLNYCTNYNCWSQLQTQMQHLMPTEWLEQAISPQISKTTSSKIEIKDIEKIGVVADVVNIKKFKM